jgi:hypothetical protein
MTTRPIPEWPLTEPEQEALHCYVEWREAAADAADAYRRWADAPLSHRACRFAEYREALDEEDFAASCYGLAAKTVRRRFKTSGG